MFLLVVERGEKGIYYTPLPIYVILAYNKQQYCIRVASDYRGRDHWTLSRHSPERRRHRRRLLLHLNRRKVEAFNTQCDLLSLAFMFATVRCVVRL